MTDEKKEEEKEKKKTRQEENIVERKVFQRENLSEIIVTHESNSTSAEIQTPVGTPSKMNYSITRMSDIGDR